MKLLRSWLGLTRMSSFAGNSFHSDKSDPGDASWGDQRPEHSERRRRLESNQKERPPASYNASSRLIYRICNASYIYLFSGQSRQQHSSVRYLHTHLSINTALESQSSGFPFSLVHDPLSTMATNDSRPRLEQETAGNTARESDQIQSPNSPHDPIYGAADEYFGQAFDERDMQVSARYG